MTTFVPKLSSGGAVKIRFTSLDLGTTRWKEGTFEILEKDNKVNLCLRFNCGGPAKIFQVIYNCFICKYPVISHCFWVSLFDLHVYTHRYVNPLVGCKVIKHIVINSMIGAEMV